MKSEQSQRFCSVRAGKFPNLQHFLQGRKGCEHLGIQSGESSRGYKAEKAARHYHRSLLSLPVSFFRIPKEKLEFPCCCLTLTMAVPTSALPQKL